MHRCTGGTAAANATTARTTPRRPWLSRTAALFQWAIPITTLALIPKCPACLAAYVMLLSGLGLSFSAADTLRTTLIALSIIALSLLLIRAARQAHTRHLACNQRHGNSRPHPPAL